jgi:hypothetical protein
MNVHVTTNQVSIHLKNGTHVICFTREQWGKTVNQQENEGIQIQGN